MRFALALLPFLALVASFTSASVAADDLLPPDKPLADVIDHYVDEKLADAKVTPAAPVDDFNYIRRVTLDLAGRIPLPVEVEEFAKSSESDKREKLVDRLLASPDFAFHQRNEFDSMLMAGRSNGEWRDYLLKCFQENRPWPRIFREMMVGRDENPAEKPALAFLKARAANLDDITNDTSKLFFGVSISCAKCHDHPLVIDWLQDHYFGMASFFNRTYVTKKKFLAERDDGIVKFKTTDGVEKEAKLVFLTGAALNEPAVAVQTDEQKKAAEKQRKEDDEKETPPPPPAYSRRAQIIDAALKPDPDGFFVRSLVNRVWDRLLGQGLVMPVDQMHSENPPSHPAILKWLARDTLAHDYDLRRLMRGIVLSRAYSRSSRWEGPGERPAAKLLAVATVRPLSPMQYSLSLLVATANPKNLADQFANAEKWSNHRRGMDGQASGFASQLELPGENFQVGVSEALLFNNGQHVQNTYLNESGDRIISALKGMPDKPQMIQTTIWSVFSRPADSTEIEEITKYLAARDDRQVAALQQVVWSMITGGEFRFNY